MEPEDVKSAACVSFEEEAEKAGSERKDDGEEFRKTGRQASSRIPTFQSSQARKRVIVQSAESSQKTDGSIQPVQKERTGSAEISRGKTLLTGGRDTALPISSARLHTSNDDVYSQSDMLDHVCTVSVHKRNHSDDQTAEITQDSNQSPLTETPTTSDLDVESTVQCETENEDTLTQHQQFPPQDANVHAKESDHVETDQVIKLQENVKKGSLQDTVDPTCQATVCGITEMVAKQSPAPCKHDECSSRRQDEAAQTDSEQSSKKAHQPISSADALHTKHTTETPTSVKASQKRFAMFHLLPLILLLSGFGLHIWQYGIPTSVSHLMSQLELHWLEGFSIGQEECTSDCRLTIVESIPEGMHFHSGSPHLPSISETWANLLNGANSSVHISAFYFTLRDSDLDLTEPSSVMGKKVFNLLKQLEPKGVKLKIAVNAPQSYIADTDELVATGAEVRGVDLQSVTGGVLHTKLWVVDKERLFVGSSNIDWRSLTQVKEVGVSIEDCSCLAHDALRIFNVYWEIGGQKNGSLPPFWPGRFSALSSSKYPLAVTFNGVPARVYLSSSPPPLSSYGRSDDLSSILSVISDAKQFIFVSVMDYLPTSQFTKPIRFWPVIDSALREASCVRGVEVKLLVSCWSHSPGAMFVFMQSLSVLSKPPLSCNIHVKVFEVPSTPEQQRIPFARVNHAKYMVTDRVVYIGTSNWSEDYFTTTAGVGLVVNQTGSAIKQGQQTVQSQLQKVFQRDWHSEYTQDLSDAHAEHCSGKRHT